MQPRPAVIVALLAVAAGVAFLVDRLVVTDREAVIARVEGAFDAAKRGDWDAFAEALDDDARWDGRGKDAAVARAKRLASMVSASTWRLTIDEVTVEGDRATVRGHVSLPGSGGALGDGARADGLAELVERDGTWRIASVSEAPR
jgi:hypothetical protein